MDGEEKAGGAAPLTPFVFTNGRGWARLQFTTTGATASLGELLAGHARRIQDGAARVWPHFHSRPLRVDSVVA
jgi:hypothetical protein